MAESKKVEFTRRFPEFVDMAPEEIAEAIGLKISTVISYVKEISGGGLVAGFREGRFWLDERIWEEHYSENPSVVKGGSESFSLYAIARINDDAEEAEEVIIERINREGNLRGERF